MKSSSFYNFERLLVFAVLAAGIGYGVKSWLAAVPPGAVALDRGEVKKGAGRDLAKPKAPGKKPARKKAPTRPSKERSETREDDPDGGVPWLKQAEMPTPSTSTLTDVSVDKTPEPDDATTPGVRMSELAWGKKLAKIHHNMHLNRKKPQPVPEAVEAELDAIDDPNAAQPIWANFARHPSHHRLVGLVLDGIKSSKSTEYLAALSVYSPDESTRESTAKALIGRKPYDFGNPLIQLINDPLVPKRETINDPVQGPFEILVVEGETLDRRFLYPLPTTPHSPDCGWNTYTADSPYMTNAQKSAWHEYNRQQQEFARGMVRLQIQSDLEQVKRINAQLAENKARALKALSIATNRSYRTRDQWSSWLASVIGKEYSPSSPRDRDTPRPTLTQIVDPLYQPTFVKVPRYT